MRLTSPFSRMPAPSFRGGASRRYKCCAPRSRTRGANCRGVLSVRFCTVTVETPIWATGVGKLLKGELPSE